MLLGMIVAEVGEFGAYQVYHLHTVEDGRVVGKTMTNDDEDRGYPNTFASWRVEYPSRDAALRATGGSHTGVSGIKVTVFLDGRQA